MKVVFYNIGYARGHTGASSKYITTGHRLIVQSRSSQRNVLDEVVGFVAKESPDVFGYAEVLTGSTRNKDFDQHAYLVSKLSSQNMSHAAVSKYGDSFLATAPFHQGNANGVITKESAVVTEHFLEQSRKKLVLEVDYKNVTIFILHLPLVATDRIAQMQEVAKLVNGCNTDVIVCGDFNIFDGIDELAALTSTTDLEVLGDGEATFPTDRPKLQLDVALARFADPAAQVPTLRVGTCAASDHLPIIIEW